MKIDFGQIKRSKWCIDRLSGNRDAWTWLASIAIPLAWMTCGARLGVSQVALAQGVTLFLSLQMLVYVQKLVARISPGLQSYCAAMCGAGKIVSVLAAIANVTLTSMVSPSWYSLSTAGVIMPILGPILPIAILTITFSPVLIRGLLRNLLSVAAAGLAAVLLVWLSAAACPANSLVCVIVLITTPSVLLLLMHRVAGQAERPLSEAAGGSAGSPFTETELLDQLQMLNDCLGRLQVTAIR